MNDSKMNNDFRNNEILKKPIFVLLSGPSGSGKTTMQNTLINRYEIMPLTYYTTREPRIDDNANFRYVSYDEYLKMLEKEKFIFSFGSHNKRYGISRQEFYEHIKYFEDMILNISYHDYFEINSKNLDNLLNIKLFILTMNDLSSSVRNRIIRRDEEINDEIVNFKVEHAIRDHNRYFTKISPYAQDILYTDVLSEEETLSRICKPLELRLKKDHNPRSFR